MKKYLVPCLVGSLALLAGCVERNRPAQSTAEEAAPAEVPSQPKAAPSETEAAPKTAVPPPPVPPGKSPVGELAGDKDIPSPEVAYNLALKIKAADQDVVAVAADEVFDGIRDQGNDLAHGAADMLRN